MGPGTRLPEPAIRYGAALAFPASGVIPIAGSHA